MNATQTTIVRLGGSMISPEKGVIDITYLKEFRKVILDHIDDGHRFAIITGGGKTCRSYQRAAEDISPDDVGDREQDMIGIFTNNLHAQVIRSIFPHQLTHEKVITHLEDVRTAVKPIVLIGAEEPGHSSNHPAVMVADYLGASSIVNLSNIDYVYDSDPKVNPNAKKYENVDWDTYLTFIPDEWEPGLSTPFDLVASADAKKLGISVIFMKGTELDSFRKFLNGESFLGTTIHP